MTTDEGPGGPADDQSADDVPPEVATPRIEAGPTFAAPEQSIEDLSKEIINAVRRAPGEWVTCRHVAGNRYRCNWWYRTRTDAFDNSAMGGMAVTTHRVGRSAMLYVTKTTDGLEIQSPGEGTPS
jgi:hypothetical protein